MTNGDIWIPFIKNGSKMMLYCQAWSGGHLEYLGKSLLESTDKIDTIIDLNVIFVGSPFLYDTKNNKFIGNEEDFIIEGYYDTEAPEELIESAEETLELVQAGNIEAAKKTKFALTSIDEKLSFGMGINASYVEEELAWLNFSENATMVDSKEEYEAIKNISKDLHCTLEYYWKDTQFLTKITDNEDSYFIVPISFLL